MIFEENDLQKLHDRYMVESIDIESEPASPFYAYNSSNVPMMAYRGGTASTTKIKLDTRGFRQLLRDAAIGANNGNLYDWERPFDIKKITDDANQYIVRFNMEETPLDQVQRIGEQLTKTFPDKRFVFIPRNVDMETADTSVLEQIRDMLSTMINDRSYDCLMGVTENT